MAKLILIALLLTLHQQATCGMLLFDQEPDLLPCKPLDQSQPAPTDISPDCHLLKLFNQTLADELKIEQPDHFRSLLDKCSCSLLSLRPLWESYYDGEHIRRLFVMVDRTIEQYMSASGDSQEEPALALPAQLSASSGKQSDEPKYPPFLWSDIDVTFYGISIYTSTSDYFDKLYRRVPHFKLNKSLAKMLAGYETWQMITTTCIKIWEDKHKLYRYLENLNRLSPAAFSRTLLKYEVVDMVYQASKACKVLLLPKLASYRLRPDNPLLVSVSDSPQAQHLQTGSFPANQREEWLEDSENAHVGSAEADPIRYRDDLDAMLSSASSYLLNCREWQTRKNSLKELELECPMMMVEGARGIPSEWITNHSTALSRSQTAVKCACQLLLHNSTWAIIMEDKNVQTMAQALTNYLNENRIPDFSSAPIMSLFGWFQDVMRRFENRKMSIKEIMKVKYRDQDPTIVMKHDTHDESLELLRRGCNYIMFNYNKGSPEAASELKLIRYLDNLQTISRDPMFVFHLSLQDPNLFKLNALSKMCKPIVS